MTEACRPPPFWGRRRLGTRSRPPAGVPACLPCPRSRGVVVAVLGALLAVAVEPLLGALLALTALAVAAGAHTVVLGRQRRLTGALATSQAAFRTLVKSSVDPVVILDGNLHVTFASQSAADLLGVQPADVAGRNLG